MQCSYINEITNYVMIYKNVNLEANRLTCALLTRAYSVEIGTILCKSAQMQFFFSKLCEPGIYPCALFSGQQEPCLASERPI